MEKRDLVKEGKDFITKAKKLKSEFKELPYSERLKFMDDNFGGASSVYEGLERVEIIDGTDKYRKVIPILSIEPVVDEEIKLYNEWKIKLFESIEQTLDFSFERLKKAFDDHIVDIKNMGNKHPELSISTYTQEQISLYKEKVQSRDVQLQWKEFGGAWDISKKVIINLGPFLKARAYYNYLSFLENKFDIDQNTIIEKIHLELIYRNFKNYFREEDEKTWLQRFVYPCQIPVDCIIIDSRVKDNNDRLVLIAILGVIQEYGNRPNFDFNQFVLDRFGIKGFKKAKNEHKDKPNYIIHFEKCKKFMMN